MPDSRERLSTDSFKLPHSFACYHHHHHHLTLVWSLHVWCVMQVINHNPTTAEFKSSSLHQGGFLKVDIDTNLGFSVDGFRSPGNQDSDNVEVAVKNSEVEGGVAVLRKDIDF